MIQFNSMPNKNRQSACCNTALAWGCVLEIMWGDWVLTDEHKAQRLFGPAQAADAVAPAQMQLRIQHELPQRLIVRQQAALQRSLSTRSSRPSC